MNLRRALALCLCLSCGSSPSPDVFPSRPDPQPITTTSTTSTEAPPLNVLVLLLDDVGVDKIAAYNLHPQPATTPNINALASEGVRFRNAYAAPSCSPARASLLTGRYGRRNGMGGVIAPDDSYSLPPEERTIAELLREAPTPYQSVALGKWHLAPKSLPTYLDEPNLHGFDHFAGTMGNLVVSSGWVERPGYFEWEKVVDGVQFAHNVYATTDIANDAVDQLANLPEPWFLYVAFSAPHTPMHEPPQALTPVMPAFEEADSGRAVYDLMLQAADTEIGRIVDSMTPELRDRTLILLLGDNGTPSYAVRPPWRSVQSKLSPFEGGSRVPLIVVGPGVAAGEVSDALVHVVDLLPTVIEGAGLTVDDQTVLDGQSLWPYLADPSLPGQRQTLYTERFAKAGPPPFLTDHRMLRNGTHKLIRVNVQERFYALDDAFEYEGEALDVDTLSANEQAQFTSLSAELDALEQSLILEVTWP